MKFRQFFLKYRAHGALATLVFLALFVFLGGVLFLFIQTIDARSPAEVTSERIASTVGEELLEKIDRADGDNSLSSLGSCSGDILSGEKLEGYYEVRFLDDSNNKLSCSSHLSRIISFQVTGYFEGVKFIFSFQVRSGSGSGFRCSGGRSEYTEPYAGDETGLTTNVAWKYAATNTDRKCEFRCQTGYSWNGVLCSEGGDYITTGHENQVKMGSFGVQGAFKAYGGINLNGKKITNVATPFAGSDMANKAYVDEAVRTAFGG